MSKENKYTLYIYEYPSYLSYRDIFVCRPIDEFNYNTLEECRNGWNNYNSKYHASGNIVRFSKVIDSCGEVVKL